MPDHPEIPDRGEKERAPDPERIIERIINGRLTPRSLPLVDPPTAD